MAASASAASTSDIRHGMSLRQVLAIVREFRAGDAATPVVLMGYANPIEAYDLKRGKNAFVRDAAKAGVDGVLVVDYPPEECAEFAATLKGLNEAALRQVARNISMIANANT